MSEEQTAPAARAGPARRRPWLRRLLALAVVIAATPLVLTLAYRFVPPPSTLMLGRWLTGKPVDRIMRRRYGEAAQRRD